MHIAVKNNTLLMIIMFAQRKKLITIIIMIRADCFLRARETASGKDLFFIYLAISFFT